MFHFLHILYSFLFVLFTGVLCILCIQVVTYNQGDKIEFVRLEELKSPTVVRGIGGEKGMGW